MLVMGTAFAPEARAQEGKFYVGLNVPVMFIDDTKSTTTGSQALAPPPAPATRYTAKSTSEYDTGFKVAGTVGYELGGGLRVEGELFFARAEVAKVTHKGVSVGVNQLPITVDVPIDGTADQLGGFASVWYDTDNVILQAGYRFQAASDLEFKGSNAGGSVNVESGLRAHFLEIGVRYRL